MALPADLTIVHITGNYVDVLGNPIAGQVRFTPRATLTDLAYSEILINNAVSAQLDALGSFSIYLPATDDPDVSPNGWTYHVEEAFTNGRSYDISVPAATVGALDLATVVPSVSDPGTAALYVSAAQYAGLDARETALETATATLLAAAGSYGANLISPLLLVGI